MSMEPNIKDRVLHLIQLLSANGNGHNSIRAFCMSHDINYGALYNSFKQDAIGIKTVDAFKKAVPNLNINWFLYAEGEPLLSHKLPT